MDRNFVVPKRSRWLDIGGGVLLYLLAAIGLLSLVIPTLIVIVESFDTRQFVAFPPQGFSLSRYIAVFQSDFLIHAAVLSLICALITVAIDCLLGIPAAIALVRGTFPRKEIFTAFLLSPIMLPGIVIGISILIFYSFLGESPSLPLMILSHVAFTLPFMIRLTMTRMERTDPSLEEASQNLGASSSKVFWFVLLPQLWPGIIAGGGFSFLNSFDNLDISLFTAPIRQRPLPIELFYLTRFNIDTRVSAIAALEFMFALALVLLAYKKMGSKGVMHDL